MPVFLLEKATYAHYEVRLSSVVLIVVVRCLLFLLVCVGVLWPSQPNGVMSSAVSLPNHTFTGQA